MSKESKQLIRNLNRKPVKITKLDCSAKSWCWKNVSKKLIFSVNLKKEERKLENQINYFAELEHEKL